MADNSMRDAGIAYRKKEGIKKAGATRRKHTSERKAQERHDEYVYKQMSKEQKKLILDDAKQMLLSDKYADPRTCKNPVLAVANELSRKYKISFELGKKFVDKALWVISAPTTDPETIPTLPTTAPVTTEESM